MYVITAIIVICVVLLFLRGLYLSYLDSIKEDISPPRQLTNEEKLRAAYLSLRWTSALSSSAVRYKDFPAFISKPNHSRFVATQAQSCFAIKLLPAPPSP